MFARSVSMRLKAGSVGVEEFTRTSYDEVILLLRNHTSFLNEIALIAPSAAEALGTSLWDVKEAAEAYHRGPYPKGLKTLESPPEVQPCLVTNLTPHKEAAHAAA